MTDLKTPGTARTRLAVAGARAATDSVFGRRSVGERIGPLRRAEMPETAEIVVAVTLYMMDAEQVMVDYTLNQVEKSETY